MKLANQVDGATVRSNPRQGEPPPWQAHAPNTAAQDSLTLTHTKRFKPGTHNEDRRWLYLKIGRLLFIVATQKAQSTLHRDIFNADSVGVNYNAIDDPWNPYEKFRSVFYGVFLLVGSEKSKNNPGWFILFKIN